MRREQILAGVALLMVCFVVGCESETDRQRKIAAERLAQLQQGRAERLYYASKLTQRQRDTFGQYATIAETRGDYGEYLVLEHHDGYDGEKFDKCLAWRSRGVTGEGGHWVPCAVDDDNRLVESEDVKRLNFRAVYFTYQWYVERGVPSWWAYDVSDGRWGNKPVNTVPW